MAAHVVVVFSAAAALAALGCGSIKSEAVDAVPAPPATSLVLTGCSTVTGDRPASTGTAAAPEVAGLSLGATAPGQPLSGTLTLHDADGDAKTLIVQVNRANQYFTCPLSSSDLISSQVDLGKLTVDASSPAGSYLVYFGAQDAAGNVSGYTVTTITVGAPAPVSLCAPAAPVQLMGKVPSASTSFYAQTNGTTSNYLLDTSTGVQLSIVDRAQLFIDLGTCTQLHLAGDAAGTTPVGWDNCFLVEYRSVPGGPIDKTWYYCSVGATIYDVAAPDRIVDGLAPTVPGTTLDPPVPNAAPFGYPPGVIDDDRGTVQGVVIRADDVRAGFRQRGQYDRYLGDSAVADSLIHGHGSSSCTRFCAAAASAVRPVCS